MDAKKAFVFDTNFIIQKKDLDEVFEALSDRFTVYVTQVSVDERIAQECRDVKARFDDLTNIAGKYAHLATISFKKTCDEEQAFYKTGMQKKYEEAFQERLIPLVKDGAMLSAVLDRAYSKKAPFLSDEKASDKGFKDALIWESMLAYFKEKGENEVLFITDDGGFTKNADALCAEFNKVTGKQLSIHPNSYYRELLIEEQGDVPAPPKRIPNVEKLRERIQDTIFDLCFVTAEDNWGREEYNETFFLNRNIETDDVRIIFNNLKQKIVENLFESYLPASTAFCLDGVIKDTEYRIPVIDLEHAVDLFDEILEQYSDYLEQFYSAVANIMNRNYRERTDFSQIMDDDDLPF